MRIVEENSSEYHYHVNCPLYMNQKITVKHTPYIHLAVIPTSITALATVIWITLAVGLPMH